LRTRRDFLKLAAAATVAGAASGRAAETVAAGVTPTPRQQWLDWLDQLARPVLEAGAAGRLHEAMPVARGTASRTPFAALEAVGRLLAGIAPWLELEAGLPDGEAALQARCRRLARDTIAHLVDRHSPAAVDFSAGEQIVVDAAFLAEALLRAPQQLWNQLDAGTKANLVAAMQTTRTHRPRFNNHLIFSALIEAWLARAGQAWDSMRVDYALRQHEQWYRGDGCYSDGPEFHFDYYNSIVIHPMLLDLIEAVSALPEPERRSDTWEKLGYPARLLARAQRNAAIHERLISPEGTLPPVGRSLSFRSGVLHGLADIALRRKLPEPLKPAQVREALGAVMHRLLDASGTFDGAGWLQIGFSGNQPALGEPYISTGSLYLTALSLLPLGLPPSDSFWTAPAERWTSQRVYAGENVPRDQALKLP